MSIKTEMAEGEGRPLGDMLEVIRFTEGVSVKLHRVLDEAKIYQVVREEFSKSDRYTVGIMLLDDDGASLKVVEVSMASSKLKMLEKASGLQAKEFNIKLSDSSICRQVVGEGKTIHANIGDMIREFLPRPMAYLISKTMGYDKQSSILTPLHRHGKVIGVLAMSCTDLCEYLIHSVENLALHVTTALELVDEYNQRKEAVQALKRYHDHLGELVEERTAELKAVNEKLLEEITERKQAGEALRKTEQEKSAILNSMSELMVYQDTEHRILLTNKAAAESVALPVEQLVGRRCYEIWHQSNKPCVGCPVAKARETGKPQEAEMTTPDGRVWFVRGYPVRDADENLVGVVEVALDITERKQAEEALRESREKFQKMFESVTDGISVVDLNGIIIETNPRAAEMHGFASRDELVGRNALELVSPRDHERIAANMRRAIKQGTIRGVEYTLVKADGTEFPGELSTSILKDAAGNWVGHITIARDITKRKQAEKALRESEEWFRSIVENSQAGIMILDDAYRFVYVNDELCRISGHSRDELIGQDFRQFLDEGSKELVADRYIRRQRGEEVPPRYEFNIIKKDGQKRRVEISSAVIKDSAGEVKTVAQLMDITERKQAEEALQAEKNKLQSVIDAMEYSLTIQDRDYNIIYQNEPSRIASGGDHIGEKCYRAYEGEEKVCDGCPVEKAFKDGKSHTSERRTIAPSGEVIFWENTASPVRDAKGKIVSCLELARDITKRKQAEEALQAEKNKLQSLIGAMEYGLSIQDREYNIIYQNEPLTRNYGDRVGEKCYRVYEVKEKVCDGCPVKKAFKDGKSRTVEREVVMPSGEVGFGEVTASPIRDAGGEIVSCLEVIRNITKRKRMEEALADEATRRRILVDQSRDGIVVLDENGKVYESNRRFAEMLGYSSEEVRELHVWDWDTQWTREQLLGMVQSVDEAGDHFVTYHRRKDGTVIDVEISTNGAVCAGQKLVFCVCRDITERKQAEEKEKQLQQELYLAQRLASVGELAAGVAHEINNPLTGVLGFSQRLMRKSTDEKVSRDLEIIHSEAQRAAEVVQSLLTFARRRQSKKEYANINDIVNKALELRAYALQTGNVEVVTTLAPSLPQIMVDFPQTQEVFLNIILNAEQAMSEAHGKGKLVIKSRRIKGYVRISFADDGPGIPPENLDKVFDPFFTTREEKGGTGLGLSACHGIVTEHGGRIYARSKPGKGATFFVELPLSPAEAVTGHRA